MWIHKDFNIAEKVWWTPHYFEFKGVDKMAKTIQHQQKVVKKEQEQDYEFLKGYADYHFKKYLLECVAGESNIKLTYHEIEALLSTCFLTMLYYFIFVKETYKLVKKLRNLREGCQELFPDIFAFERHSLKDFDLTFIKKVHCLVGKDIVDNVGEFRTKFTKPAKEDFWYLAPGLIDDHLTRLLEETRAAFSQPNLDILDAVKYAACFFSYFLSIHPFCNGNGRTARLLLSYLLTPFTIVPLSLYSSGEMRDVYLQCLRESRNCDGYVIPNALSRFILDAIEREYSQFCFVMDISVTQPP